MSSSKAVAARDIAVATNTKSNDGLNSLDAIMNKYDKNGDGVFQVEECVNS